MARGWKRDTILVSPSFCLFDSVHLFSEAGERGRGEVRKMVSARLSRFPDRDEIGNLKFTRDEIRSVKIGSFI